MASLFQNILAQFAKHHATRARTRFQRLATMPERCQRERLFEQVERERPTAFGRNYHFAAIKSVDDFRRNIPITRYEDYEPYIERVKRGEFDAMFSNQRVVMFAMTSGTTASRKFVPVTERFLADYRRGWTIWGLHLFESHRHLWFKTMVQLVSDWDEFRTEAGIPCGSISGLTTQMQRYVVRKTYCLPPESAKLKNVRDKYYLAWRLGLVRDVGLLVSANPSTMINLARFGEEHKESLIRDVFDGTIDTEFCIPAAVLNVERPRLKANPKRARELERVIARTGALRPKDAWPNLGAVGNWMGGSMAAYLRNYPQYFGSPSIRDIGLIASEGRMTIPIENDTPGGILDVESGFFEFIPANEIDSAQPTVLESHELKEGEEYFILLTTASGFYRYNIHDVVRCLGWFERTPILAFLNKGSRFSNLTGEKLSEHQATEAVAQALAALDLRLSTFSIAPLWDDELPSYGLFIEISDLPDEGNAKLLADEVERRLTELNSEYATKRESRRLGPLQLCLLPAGTWERWDRDRLAKAGGTAEQYKHPCLISDVGFAATMPVSQT